MRIPKPILQAASLREGDPVALEVVEGAIVIHRTQGAQRLEDLVQEIRPGNRHGETDWGDPTGAEAW